MTAKNGLPCEGIFSFVEDKEKRWWLNTQCGVVEFSDSEFERWWANPETVIRTHFYDALDGARPSARPPFKSSANSSDGRVWFANSGVVQMLDPSRLSQKALPAVTFIESVTVERKDFAATDNLRLPPHPRDMQIDYTSPTFTIPQKVEFRYRLDPIDHDWPSLPCFNPSPRTFMRGNAAILHDKARTIRGFNPRPALSCGATAYRREYGDHLAVSIRAPHFHAGRPAHKLQYSGPKCFNPRPALSCGATDVERSLYAVGVSFNPRPALSCGATPPSARQPAS